MQGIKLVQSTIVYLEDHLFESVTLDDLGKALGTTPYHINQTFTMITGMNPFEYVYRRKMTEAARDILSGHYRLVDTAEKYGFLDAHQFSESFSSYHGVSPIQARTHSDKLKLLNRLYVQYSTTEQPPMDYQIQIKDNFRLVGYRMQIRNDELDHHFLIPDLLFDAHENGHFEHLKQFSDGPLYVVTHPFQGGLEVFYGVKNDEDSILESEYLYHNTYAVIGIKDHIDYAFNKIWQSVESQIDIMLNYVRDDYYIAVLPLDINFESDYSKIELWLPINE